MKRSKKDLVNHSDKKKNTQNGISKNQNDILLEEKEYEKYFNRIRDLSRGVNL